MTKRRGPYKPRNKEITMQHAIDTVGTILKNEGFRELGPNKVALRSGIDKKTLYGHFNTFNNLLKMYIKSKDFWAPIFEKFNLSKPPKDDELMDFIILIFQEQFRYFFSDKEMQQFILWQISESKAVLREISDEREANGALISKLIEPHFTGSETYFPETLSIVLGGIYYVVWYAGTNGSVVCGVDINDEKQWRRFSEAIGQIIESAWNMGLDDGNQKLNSIDIVENEMDLLCSIANKLNEDEYISDTDQKALFKNELQRVERVIFHQLASSKNATQIQICLRNVLNPLVEICDLLYRPDRALNVEAGLVLDLLKKIGLIAGRRIPDEVRLPALFRDLEGIQLEVKWKVIELDLLHSGIELELIKITELPFRRFCQSKTKMCWADFKYLRKYGEKLEEMLAEGSVTARELCCKLIEMGYNHSRFTAFYARKLTRKMSLLEDKLIKDMLDKQLVQLRRLPLYVNMKFDGDKIAVRDELVQWTEAEIALQELKDSVNPHRIHTKLQQVQMFVWQNLQLKYGIYDEADQEQLLKKTAYNFTGIGQKPFSDHKSQVGVRQMPHIKSLIPILENMLKEVRDM